MQQDHEKQASFSATMKPEQEIDQTGVPPVEDSPVSHSGAESVTSVETVHEDPETRALVRKLLWKLDTRCVFFGTQKAYSY